nr:2TM domain-containing protein [Methanobrevibacter arboriphilus]
MENYDDKAYKRAKKRVDDVKGFYIHLVTYIIINFFCL